MTQYYGKYRAFVVDNNDPDKQGRIKVQVPYISGDGVIGWCLPCVPVACKNGGDFNIPKVGSFVWVEFEHGDIKYPIYTGGIYGSQGTPHSDVNTRIVSWGNCSIIMQENSLTLRCGSNEVVVTPTDTKVNSLSASSVSATGSISAGGTVSGSNI